MTPLLLLASCACLVGSPQSTAPTASPVASSTTAAPPAVAAAPAPAPSASWRVGAAAATSGALAVATSVVGLINVALALDLAEDSRQSVEGTALRGADVVQAEQALLATGVAFYAGLAATALSAAGTVALWALDEEAEDLSAFGATDAAPAGAASTTP